MVNTKCQGTKKFGSLFLSFSSWTCCSCWWWWCWAQQNCSEFVLVRVLLQSKLHYDNNLFLPAANVWTELLSAPGNDQSKLNKFSKAFFLVSGLKGFPSADVTNKRSYVMLKWSTLIGCSMSHGYFNQSECFAPVMVKVKGWWWQRRKIYNLQSGQKVGRDYGQWAVVLGSNSASNITKDDSFSMI